MITVVIPVHNAERFIQETIQSVLDQQRQDIEIICILDNCTDNSENLIRQFGDKRIQIETCSFSEPSGTRNIGIKKSAGEFIAFLDADDIWEPSKLNRQLALFSNPEIGLVYTRTKRIDIHNNPVIYKSTPRLLRGNVLEAIIYDNFITCSSVVVRSRLLKEHHIMFRSERKGAEDWDMWIQLAQHTQIDFIDDQLTQYREYDGNTSSKIDGMHRSRVKVIEDCIRMILNSEKYSRSEQERYLKQCRKARSLCQLRYGHQLLAAGRIQEAKSAMQLSLKNNMYTIQNWWGLVKAYILTWTSHNQTGMI